MSNSYSISSSGLSLSLRLRGRVSSWPGVALTESGPDDPVLASSEDAQRAAHDDRFARCLSVGIRFRVADKKLLVGKGLRPHRIDKTTAGRQAVASCIAKCATAR